VIIAKLHLDSNQEQKLFLISSRGWRFWRLSSCRRWWCCRSSFSLRFPRATILLRKLSHSIRVNLVEEGSDFRNVAINLLLLLFAMFISSVDRSKYPELFDCTSQSK
jgi:hypothetical protein